MLSGAVLLAAFVTLPARAQVTAGIGGGGGIGSRGGNVSSAHAAGFVEVSLPILPALRAEAIDANTSGEGTLSLVASGVFSVPVPLITPYVLAGWGLYGLDGNGARSGWSVGAGLRTALPAGPGLFLEVRRHQRIARDLLTVGLRF